jgi:DNA-binding GntR family transcriptional regulator
MCLDYVFWPRQQLHIEELAGLLSPSSTPVREALARLAGEGLIEAVPNRGYVAKTLSEDEMRGNLDLLFTLLKESISHSLPESWIERVDACPPELKDGGEATFSFVNDTFSLIGRLSDNEVIIEYVSRLLEFTRFVRRLDLEDPNAVTSTRRFVEGLRESLAAGHSSSALQLDNSAAERSQISEEIYSVVGFSWCRSSSYSPGSRKEPRLMNLKFHLWPDAGPIAAAAYQPSGGTTYLHPRGFSSSGVAYCSVSFQ